jgi:hypothetical protein
VIAGLEIVNFSSEIDNLARDLVAEDARQSN